MNIEEQERSEMSISIKLENTEKQFYMPPVKDCAELIIIINKGIKK